MAPISLAKARAIDLSIQFSLFWMPLFVLIAWWTHKPLCLLFDMFEIAVLVGACFLVNYVTADAKTNWAEGCAMVGFYAIIVSVAILCHYIECYIVSLGSDQYTDIDMRVCLQALCAWFYPGQPEVKLFLQPQSIAFVLANGGLESLSGHGGEAAAAAAPAAHH